ncbi:MAG: hypothetical protein RLZZ115_3190 [Cyanobacteriota bacterium]|jgi:hypothetical protein
MDNTIDDEFEEFDYSKLYEGSEDLIFDPNAVYYEPGPWLSDYYDGLDLDYSDYRLI